MNEHEIKYSIFKRDEDGKLYVNFNTDKIEDRFMVIECTRMIVSGMIDNYEIITNEQVHDMFKKTLSTLNFLSNRTEDMLIEQNQSFEVIKDIINKKEEE